MKLYRLIVFKSYFKGDKTPPPIEFKNSKLIIGCSNNLPIFFRWFAFVMILTAMIAMIAQAITKQTPVLVIIPAPILLIMYCSAVVQTKLEVDVNKSQMELFQHFIFFQLSIHKQHFNEKDDLYIYTSKKKYMLNGKFRKFKGAQFLIGDKTSKESVLLFNANFPSTTKSAKIEMKKQLQELSSTLAKALSTDIYFIDEKENVEHITLDSLS
jgi:hypothetical protein